MRNKMFFKTVMILGVAFFTTTAFAQDCADFAAFPGGEEEGKKVHVLYRDLMEKEKYDEAFPMWEQLYTKSPAGSAYHFIDGVTLYTDKINNEENEEKATALKEKVIEIYDARLACEVYKNKGIVLEAMAYSMSEIGYEDYDKTLATYKEAVKENGNNTSAYILAYYADHVVWMFGEDLIDKETAREAYLTMEAIKDANADNEEYTNNWEYVVDYYEPYEIYLFDCDYFIGKLKPEYEANPDKSWVYRPILKTLLTRGCTVENPFVKELAVKDSIEISRINDSLMIVDKSQNPDYYGIRLMKQGDETGAIPYLEQATQNAALPAERKANANYYLARIYHSKGGSSNFSKARQYYEAAASLKAGWGEPYYQIGVLYASSGPLCGPGTGWDSQVVIWPAMDMWNKAINSGDAEAAAQAKKKINYYSQFLPTTEDAFQKTVKAGSSYTVKCWIQRKTTVRLRNQY
ncbi:MAG: tetratricopeptide repeat protein [Saprospiraceae bacterium]